MSHHKISSVMSLSHQRIEVAPDPECAREGCGHPQSLHDGVYGCCTCPHDTDGKDYGGEIGWQPTVCLCTGFQVEAAPVDAGTKPTFQRHGPDLLGRLTRFKGDAERYMVQSDAELARLRASLESMRERAEKAEARGLELEQAVSAHICNTCYRWNCCEHDTGCPKTSAEKENA